MKQPVIVKNMLFSAITFAMASSAIAVTDEEFRTLQQQLEQLADQVESNSRSTGSDTSIGGYGELHYNNLSNGQGNDKRELDLHRFVLFFNHEFNDDIRLFSELEIEHGLVKDTADGSNGGEVEVEQAYVQFDLTDNTQANVGIFLIPVGILNETHEPPTFYGVERNPVESNIIPSTWWEGGAMLSGHSASGFSYNLALTSGLEVDPATISIRSSRQKVSNANARHLALTARAKYTGISGLEVAATVQYNDDVSQDSSDDVDSATLVEAHARYNIAALTFTGLYARWEIDGAGADALNKDVQDGGYLEASYKLNPNWGVFVRQNGWDNGGTGDTAKAQTDFGFNYWPHEDVVLKADYQLQNTAAGNFDGFNLGVGYQF